MLACQMGFGFGAHPFVSGNDDDSETGFCLGIRRAHASSVGVPDYVKFSTLEDEIFISFPSHPTRFSKRPARLANSGTFP